jgi:hypothetical protein
MPIYTSSLGTAGVTTGNAANTESPGTWSLKTASQGRNLYLIRMDVIGRASALTTISGMAFRILTFTTASTAGTAFTPTSTDVTANETATGVGASGQTVSVTGRKQHAIFGCGAAGPGGYVAANQTLPGSMVCITPNATAPSIDAVQVSTTASLTYEWSFQHAE